MIIIPTGVDEAELNRYPWVTIVLIILCVLAFFATLRPNYDFEDAVHNYVMFYESHPYLEHPEEMKKLFDLRSLYGSEFDALPPTGEIAENQAHLEELTARIMEELERARAWELVLAEPTIITLFTHAFLHGDLFHLLGNMLFLYCLGTFVEDRYGRGFFVGFYLLAAGISGFCYTLHYPESMSSLVGASGAISAVMGAFLLMFHRARIQMSVFIFYFYRFPFYIRAWVLLPLFFLMDLMWAYLGDRTNPGEGTQVAHWVHVWGFAFGMGTALLLRFSGLEKKLNPMGIDLDSAEHNPLTAAREAKNKGQVSEAVQILMKGVKEYPEREDLAQELWQVARAHGDKTTRKKAYSLLIGNSLKSDHLEGAEFYWSQARKEMTDFFLPPNMALTLCRKLLAENDPRFRATACGILSIQTQDYASAKPTSAMAICTMLAPLDPARALEITNQCLGRDDLLERDRRRLMELRDELSGKPEVRAARKPSAPTAGEVSPAAAEEGISLSDDDAPIVQHEAPASEIPLGRSISVSSREEADDTFTRPVDEVQSIDVSLDETLSMTMESVEVKPFAAVPLEIDRQGLKLQIEDKGARRIRFDQIQMIAMAALRKPDGKPMLVVDLVMDRADNPKRRIRVMRIRTSSFNPMKLYPDAGSPMKALMSFNRAVLRYSGATMLPNDAVFAGQGITTYSTEAELEAGLYGIL